MGAMFMFSCSNFKPRNGIIFEFYPCHLWESKLCLSTQYFVPRPNRSHAPTLRPPPTSMVWTSLVSKKWKESLVLWATFLVTWGGAYGVKSVIITFYIQTWVFWWRWLLHGMVCKICSVSGKAKNELQGKFFLTPIQFKTWSLTLRTYNYTF